MAVKKWTQGMPSFRGRMDTMLPVVRKPSESIQIPLALSLRMLIITSADTEPVHRGQRSVKEESEEIQNKNNTQLDTSS